MNTYRIICHRYLSPCGSLLLGSYGDTLCLCDWEDNHHRAGIDKQLCTALMSDFEEGTSPVINEAVCQLTQYFTGLRTDFDIPYLLIGTEFRKTVWTALPGICYGTTVSYADVAARIGMPKAVRAVANAVGANPLSIIVPCHRVIGRSGALTGYAGGLAAKEYLLELEKTNRINDEKRGF